MPESPLLPPSSEDDLQRVLALNVRGMSAVQELIAVLRESTDQLVALTRRVHELEQLAATDTLTGLANRRGLEEAMRRLDAHAARYGTPVAVVMLDIDDLRTINDRHSHHAGDVLLRGVAVALRACARGSDVIARTGGDEFVALLPGSTPDGARAFLERLTAAAQFVRLPDGAIVPVRFAIGIAGRDEAGSLAPAIDLADSRLIVDKQRT